MREKMYWGGRAYYYYSTYDDWKTAYNKFREFKRRDKTVKYKILRFQTHYGTMKFPLYMSKVKRIYL